MNYCEKCGAYIPIGDTACPACGYDPEAEAKKAREEAEEKARLEKKAAAAKAKEERERQAREAEEARRASEQQRWQQDPRQHTYTGGAAQGQYASQRTYGTGQAHYASQRTGGSTVTDEEMRRRASDSVRRERLSVLSYLGIICWLIPFLKGNDDPFRKFHTNQGLILIIFHAVMTALGGVLGIFGTLGAIGYLIGIVIGIGNVLKGKMEPLPFIGNFDIIK